MANVDLVRYETPLPARRLPTQEDWQRVKDLALDAVTSPHTKRAYGHALDEFLAWYQTTQPGALSRQVINKYKSTVLEKRRADKTIILSPSTINQSLAAIRKLVNEASAPRGEDEKPFMSREVALDVMSIKGSKRQGVRSGKWLTETQAQKLLDLPKVSTLKGSRDQAMFAIFIGAGLRREEVARLTIEHFEQSGDHRKWHIKNLVGKHGRVRTVPIADWVKESVDSWLHAAGITTGLVFRTINKAGLMDGGGITAHATYFILRGYVATLGVGKLAPHDLRRTLAKLANRSGVELQQIQLVLGHASVKTTEAYLGLELDLDNPPSERFNLKIRRAA